MNKILFSSNTDDWKTPKYIYDYFVIDHDYIDCFPYQSKYNEFDNNYKDCKLFINPPFSKLKQVTEWIIQQFNNGCTIVLIIPARTDTRYFHKLLKLHPMICFFDKRLKFSDSKSAPFPTLLLKFAHGIDVNRYFSISPFHLGVY